LESNTRYVRRKNRWESRLIGYRGEYGWLFMAGEKKHGILLGIFKNGQSFSFVFIKREEVS
jgi:hypothetical protein